MVGYALASVKTSFVKITVTSVYGKFNNGAAKIEFWTSGGDVTKQPFHDWASKPTAGQSSCVYIDSTQDGFKVASAFDKECRDDGLAPVANAVDCEKACAALGAGFSEVRSRKRAVKFFGWVFFLISSGSPHVHPMARMCR